MLVFKNTKQASKNATGTTLVKSTKFIIVKALLVFQIIKFFNLTFWSYKKWFDEKDKVILKLMASQPG